MKNDNPASEAARLLGSITSPRKAKASKENGKHGGRKREPEGDQAGLGRTNPQDSGDSQGAQEDEADREKGGGLGSLPVGAEDPV